MITFLIRRIMEGSITVAVVVTLVFFGVFAIGNPVDILVHPNADQAEIARATAALGLDRTVWEQFGLYLKNILSGNLGDSFVFSQPALWLIVDRFPATMELALLATVFSIVIGLPLGLWAAIKPSSISARSIMAGSVVGFSVPSFWFGLILIMVFAVHLNWLPASGRGEVATYWGITSSLFTVDGVKHILLPALNLSLAKIALVIRLTRAGALETLRMDFIKFARAKGISESRIIRVHVLRNILIPIVTVMGLEFGSTIAYAIVTETVYAWPGMGKLIIDSINFLDRPVIVAYILVVVVMFVVINTIVDITYTLLDPRARLAGTGG